MKRYQSLLGPVVLGLCAWGAILNHCLRSGKCDRAVQDVVGILPLYCLMVFGCYALAKIGMGLMTFNDCSQEARDLDEEILAAKADLTKRGFRFS